MTTKIKILIEDEHFVAVSKAPGQLVVADRFGLEKNILLHELGERLRGQGHKADTSGRDLYPVHRLDRDTSGIVLFAKHQDAHRALSKKFESREMEKVYWALALGNPVWDQATCAIPLSRAEGKKGRGRALVDLNNGKEAETAFKILERFSDVCLIEARPRTGRLHQIRIHLRAMGMPLVVDPAYGFTEQKSKWENAISIRRTPLHARELSFEHPFTKEKISIICPLEEDFRTQWNVLKKLQEEV